MDQLPCGREMCVNEISCNSELLFSALVSDIHVHSTPVFHVHSIVTVIVTCLAAYTSKHTHCVFTGPIFVSDLFLDLYTTGGSWYYPNT